MKYLVTRFNAKDIKSGKILWKDVCFNVKDMDTSILVAENNAVPQVVDLKFNVQKFDYLNDEYYLLFNKSFAPSDYVKIKDKNFDLDIFVSSEINVSSKGEKIFSQSVEDISFSHYEIFEDACLVFFDGKRKFLLAVKNEEVVFADFYDEYNHDENEKLFLKRCEDSLNHGKVFSLKKSGCENYLVYLDDFDLNLKSEFVSLIFMDCLKVGNLKYCNNLLCEDLKRKDEKQVKEFFPDFDDFVVLKENKILLLQKNTPVGAFEFKIKDNQIFNIIHG